MKEPREYYDFNANNVTGTPIEEDYLVPIQLWREQEVEIEKLKKEVEYWQNRKCVHEQIKELKR